MANAQIKRLPFRLAQLIGHGDKSRIVIAAPDATGYYLESSYPLGIPIDMVFFIHLYCECSYCGAGISRELCRCSCGKPELPKLHLDVECSNELYYSKFKPILDRENGRIKALNRRKRIEENGGSVSKDDIAKLYAIQDGICYFCGNPISNESEGGGFHVDHYESLYAGGRNDISNVVLTCASCNLRKGKMHGAEFEFLARKFRAPENGLKLRKIRRRLRNFLTSHFQDLDRNHVV